MKWLLTIPVILMIVFAIIGVVNDYRDLARYFKSKT